MSQNEPQGLFDGGHDDRSQGIEPYKPIAEPQQASQETYGVREAISRSAGKTWLLVLVTGGLTLGLFLFTSIVASLIALVIVNRGTFPTKITEEMLGQLMINRMGFVITVLVPQLSLLVVPFLASLLLPEGPRKGLRLVRGRWPWWGWAAAVAATPLVGTISSVLLGSFAEESESLKAMTEAFRHHATSGFLIPTLLLIGVTPALCEEVFFRGFLQPRLTRLLPPAVGVFLSSLAFALLHLDPIHVVGVLPLGLWLGFLSYRSGSLYPAMLGHLVNNVLSVAMVMSEDTNVLDLPDMQVGGGILVLGLLGLVGVGLASRRGGCEHGSTACEVGPSA